MDLQEYMEVFNVSEDHFERTFERLGIQFEKAESSPRSERKRASDACTCHYENGGASIWRNWISPACLECRTGLRTGSLFVDLRCTKDCYFCFNANQPDYEHYHSHQRDIVRELEQAHAAGAEYECLAITGGEPLLNQEQVIEFLECAKRLYPAAHMRLYTNGDLVTRKALKSLAKGGLDEIRFSVKPADVDNSQQRILEVMEQAVAIIPDVVIEMPVIPGSLDNMKKLVVYADEIGVRCINLLELCFPLHNAEEFQRRGFELRKHPYNYMYEYWYNGGIPVAKSENEALALLEFASKKELRIGMHYCSADNRNSAQINLQNHEFGNNADLQNAFPYLDLDEGDHFLKCVKAFGNDTLAIKSWADTRADIPYHLDWNVPSIAFPRMHADEALSACPTTELGESVYVIEDSGNDSIRLREIAVRAIC